MNKIEKELFNHMNSYRKKHKVYTYLEFVDMVIASTMDKRWTYDLDKVSGDFIFGDRYDTGNINIREEYKSYCDVFGYGYVWDDVDIFKAMESDDLDVTLDLCNMVAEVSDGRNSYDIWNFA